MRRGEDMKRIVPILVFAISATLILGGPAFAVGDTKGPACADIASGGPAGDAPGGYDQGTGQVTFGIDLSKPACQSVTYTLYVLNSDTDPTLVTSTSSYTVPSDNPTGAIFTVNLTGGDNDGLVCVYATTSAGGGKHLFDQAPNPNADGTPSCVRVEPNGGSSGRLFN
jgi:hypothetical protein